MARKSQLEGRLLAVLDATRNRSGIARWMLAAGMIMLALLVLPLAVLKPVAAQNEGRPDPEQLIRSDERVLAVTGEVSDIRLFRASDSAGGSRLLPLRREQHSRTYVITGEKGKAEVTVTSALTLTGRWNMTLQVQPVTPEVPNIWPMLRNRAAPIRETTLETGSFRRFFTGGEVWRNLDFQISADEEADVDICRRLATGVYGRENGEVLFANDETRQALERVLERRPGFFYAEYLLSTWHRLNGHAQLANDYANAALEHAPVILVQPYVDGAGEPRRGLYIQTFAIECNRVRSGSLSPSLELRYPALVTDEQGQIYLPAYDTVFHTNSMSLPDGYKTTYPRLGWFEARGRVSVLPAAIVEPDDEQEWMTGVPAFAIHRVLSEPEMTELESVSALDLNSLEIDPRPLMTDADIISYDWDKHLVRLEPGVLERMTPEKFDLKGNPFLVISNGERIYLGAFWTHISSYGHYVPIISAGLFALTIQDDGSRIADAFVIRPPFGTHDEPPATPHKDPRIRAALEAVGKLAAATEEPVAEPVPAEAEPEPPAFAIHRVLSEPDMTRPESVSALDLNSLEIDPRPLMTDADIISYDWDKHLVRLKPGVREQMMPKWTDVRGNPFLVISNGERIYLGAFWTPFSSVAHFVPVIDNFMGVTLDDGSRIADAFKIGPTLGTPDWVARSPHKDPRIRAALQAVGKLAAATEEPVAEPVPAEAEPREHPAFAIHRVLSSPDMTRPESVLALDLNHLEIDPEPLLTDADIISYDWDKQQVRLKPGVGKDLRGYYGLVMSNGERIYLGAFHSIVSSTIPLFVPRIVTHPFDLIQDDGSSIEGSIKIRPPLGTPDELASGPHRDPRIRAALQAVGKLVAAPVQIYHVPSPATGPPDSLLPEYRWRIESEEPLQLMVRGIRLDQNGVMLGNWGFGPNAAGDEPPVDLIVRPRLEDGQFLLDWDSIITRRRRIDDGAERVRDSGGGDVPV